MILYILYMFILAFFYCNKIKLTFYSIFFEFLIFFLFLTTLLIKIQFKFESLINRISKIINIIFFGQFFLTPSSTRVLKKITPWRNI